MNSNVRIWKHRKEPMTLPSDGKKLTENEEKSMKIALEQADIRAIHPERMEALADSMVEKLKSNNYNTKGSGTHWRTNSPLSE